MCLAICTSTIFEEYLKKSHLPLAPCQSPAVRSMDQLVQLTPEKKHLFDKCGLMIIGHHGNLIFPAIDRITKAVRIREFLKRHRLEQEDSIIVVKGTKGTVANTYEIKKAD